MKKNIITLFFFLLLLTTAGAEVLYQEATAPGETQEASVEAARSKALKLLFQQVPMDLLFQEIFLSNWGESILVEYQETYPLEGKGFETVLNLGLDTSAVALARGEYEEAGVERLSQIESLLIQGENSLITGDSYLTQEEYSLAKGEFEKALSLCQQADELLNTIGDTGIRSPNGSTRVVLATSLRIKQSRSKDSLVRVDELMSRNDLEDTLRIHVRQQRTAEQDLRRWQEKSPFYGEDPAVLEGLIEQMAAQEEELLFIQQQYQEIRPEFDPANQVLLSRLAVAHGDLREDLVILKRLQREVVREKNTPRAQVLATQEAEEEEKQKRRQRTLWLLTHTTRDHVAFRLYNPYIFNGDNNWEPLDSFQFSVRGEGVFGGVWLRTILDQEEGDLLGVSYSRLSQQISVGLGLNGLWGLGYKWDWSYDLQGVPQAPEEQMVSLYLGGVAPRKKWANWILSFNYRIPENGGRGKALETFNMETRLIGRLEDLFKIEGSVASYSVRQSAGEGNSLHILRAQGGLGIKVPNPFLWGVQYRYESFAPLEDPQNRVNRMGWQFYVEYSF